MLNISFLSVFAQPYTVSTLFVVGLIGIGLGYFTKQVVIAKKNKKILSLEDEMLTNHARILSMEKKLLEFKKNETNQYKPERVTPQRMEKVS